jgi:hypothetical protein
MPSQEEIEELVERLKAVEDSIAEILQRLVDLEKDSDDEMPQDDAPDEPYGAA